MFTVTEHDTRVRREAQRLEDEINGDHEAGSLSTKDKLPDMSFVDVLSQHIKLLRLLYRKNDKDPSVRVTISQRAVLEALDQANLRPDGADGLRKLIGRHLGREFVIGNILYNFAGEDHLSSLTLPSHRYTQFNISLNLGAIPDAEGPHN